MKRGTYQSLGFLAVSLLLALLIYQWQPTIYGNSPREILAYLYQEEGLRLGDHVELLAVEDVGADRFAMFRRETKRPDEFWIVRFQKDENENYVSHPLWRPQSMYSAGEEIFSWYFSGRKAGEDTCYLIWSRNPELSEIRYRLNQEPEQVVEVTENPSFTLLWLPYGGCSLSTVYLDAYGEEL